jgi:hypothetical protein
MGQAQSKEHHYPVRTGKVEEFEIHNEGKGNDGEQDSKDKKQTMDGVPLFSKEFVLEETSSHDTIHRELVFR